MTGFGAAEGPVGGGSIRVEIRTVNHRFFNPSFKLSGEIAVFEGEVREQLRKAFDRGHISVSMRWGGTEPPATALQLNLDRAREAMARLRELQTAVGLSGEIPLDLLARQSDVLTLAPNPATPVRWEELAPILDDATRDCRAMRRREGEVLAGELEGRLRQIGALAERVAQRAPERVVAERERLQAAVNQLVSGAVDEGRLAQEIAFLADRLDITEELVRLTAHLGAARAALAQDGPVGKQLGFLAQELGREINTIGSKANDATIAHWVVAMKGELEKFREQVENLE